MSKIINIAKNTSYLMIALVIQKIISFSYFIVLARNLDPSALGKYYFAISFTTIFAIFIDIGLNNVITREIAKTKERAKILLGNILSIKIPLSFISLFFVIFIIKILKYDEITRQLVYLSSVCMILDSFTAIFYSVNRGFHNLKYESFGSAIFMAIATTFGLIALYFEMGLLWIMSALVVASVFNFLFSSFWLIYKWKIPILPQYNISLLKIIIKLTIPFGLFAIFQRLYMYLDTVILSIMLGDKYVGLYQISFKIIFALQFLPMAFTASLYPAMSYYWLNDKKQLSITFERAMNYLIIISLPIIFGIITLADKILLLFKPEYLDAILPLQIITASLIFIFINFPIGSLLNACDKQKINTINMMIVTLISVFLNIILISKFKIIGASITVVVTNLFMFVMGIYWVSGIIKYKYVNILNIFLKSLMASIIMGILIMFLKESINIFIISIVGGMFYFGILFSLGGFKKEDILSLFNLFTHKMVK